MFRPQTLGHILVDLGAAAPVRQTMTFQGPKLMPKGDVAV